VEIFCHGLRRFTLADILGGRISDIIPGRRISSLVRLHHFPGRIWSDDLSGSPGTANHSNCDLSLSIAAWWSKLRSGHGDVHHFDDHLFAFNHSDRKTEFTEY